MTAAVSINMKHRVSLEKGMHIYLHAITTLIDEIN